MAAWLRRFRPWCVVALCIESLIAAYSLTDPGRGLSGVIFLIITVLIVLVALAGEWVSHHGK